MIAINRRHLTLSLAVLGAAGASLATLQDAQAANAGPAVQELATGLDHPWGMVFLPDGQGALITERAGDLRLWQDGKGVSQPLRGVPKVHSQGQGGLLDVALSPDFAKDRMVYLSYSEAGDGRAGTAVGRGKLAEDNASLQDFTVIFRQAPKLSNGQHFGSRLVFDRDGMLFITLGDNGQRPTAQDLDKLQGKTVRLNADGSVPKDNPFVGKDGARPEIWSYGHRNAQGMALHPQTGVVWLNEHGAQGGDEINIPKAGANHGWPLATHGVNYGGAPIPEAKGKHVPGTEQPDFVWEQSPAVSGMAFYEHARFPAWQGSIFVGALKDQSLIRLTQEGGKIVEQERLLKDRGERIRDVRQGPDGSLYVLTDSSEGKLLRVGLQE
ncbi:Soluble aldose sugar dehydrogenase, PQQ-dependent [plant metagenome]|uniref:Soluble aldose sugar dehydrogenase, PQQ-dependent n=1 Tax=plant metagenome TaxID=1297885 RepID=A0A484UVU1_9ZZZZ